jgi:hypothetical protein
MTTRVRTARLALAVLAGVVLCGAAAPAQASVLLSENFDNIGTLSGSGWAMINNSNPAGLPWVQGNTGVFGSQGGAPDSYIASSFNASNGVGNISNWLLTPEMTLGNGDTLSFYTRSEAFLPDRLEVRFSANGASTNVGGTDSSVGDFSSLLLSINPALGAGGYPSGWTLYTITLSGLSGPTSGRFGFRYFVTDAVNNGDFIGIDTVNVNSVPEPATITLVGLGLAGVIARRRRANAQKGA